MIQGKGKMIKIFCDLCKQEIKSSEKWELLFRQRHEPVLLMWDIDKNCITELEKLLGYGRVLTTEFKEDKNVHK